MASEGIKQEGKNLWRVRVKQVEKRTGKVVNRKATVTGSKADAVRVRDEIRAELKSTAAARSRTRLHEYGPSWLVIRAASLKPSTIRKYKAGLVNVLAAIGDLYVDSITPADITGYVQARVSVVGLKGGNTVLNELRMLRTMAKDSVAEGYATRDWCARVKPPKVRHYTADRPNLLTPAQGRAVLEQIPERWRGLVMFMATTGLRWGEASALHWADVDLEVGEAFIRYGNDRGSLVEPKTEKSKRRVPVLPIVAELLGKPGKGPVFTARGGKLHKGSPLNKVLTKACAKAKVPRITPHGLRRTFNNLARQETSLQVLKSITGHTTDAMVEHYSVVGADEKAKVSAAVGRSFGVPEVSGTDDE
jgi:integrase